MLSRAVGEPDPAAGDDRRFRFPGERAGRRSRRRRGRIWPCAGQVEGRAWRRRAERLGCARRVRIGLRVEGVVSAQRLCGQRARIGERRGRGDGREGSGRGAVRGGSRPGSRAPEAKFDILLEALDEVLETMLLVLQFLDAPIGLTQLVLELVDAHVERRRVSPVDRIAWDGRRRHCRLGDLRLSAMKGVEIEGAGVARADGTKAKNNCPRETQACNRRQFVEPLSVARAPATVWRALVSIGIAGPKVRRRFGPRAARAQLPAAPARTVTARRFCDQQEMSLQTATGRSLP